MVSCGDQFDRGTSVFVFSDFFEDPSPVDPLGGGVVGAGMLPNKWTYMNVCICKNI